MKQNPMEPAAGLFMCGLALLLALSGLWGGVWLPGRPSELPIPDGPVWVEMHEPGTGRVLVPLAETLDRPEKKLSGASLLALGLKMDINRASTRDLELLTGIGPFSARKIVKRRMEKGGFNTIDDLREIPGLDGRAIKSLEKWGGIEARDS